MAREDIPLDFRSNNSVEREKERNGKGREEESRERDSTFSLEFSTISRRFPAKQEGKAFFATRGASRDRKRGVLTNFER